MINRWNLGDCSNLLWQKAGPPGGAAAALPGFSMGCFAEIVSLQYEDPQIVSGILFFAVFCTMGQFHHLGENSCEYPGQFSVRHTKSPEHVSNPNHSYNRLKIAAEVTAVRRH